MLALHRATLSLVTSCTAIQFVQRDFDQKTPEIATAVELVRYTPYELAPAPVAFAARMVRFWSIVGVLSPVPTTAVGPPTMVTTLAGEKVQPSAAS